MGLGLHLGIYLESMSQPKFAMRKTRPVNRPYMKMSFDLIDNNLSTDNTGGGSVPFLSKSYSKSFPI